ncbi:MAG: hypothetical protein ABJO09_20540 [Hyphomicrobiales bacterium]|uniref:hypothetical protein n=1 Tax=Alphaproteobacteria TaxID=28211 RepID=UPI0032656ED1
MEFKSRLRQAAPETRRVRIRYVKNSRYSVENGRDKKQFYSDKTYINDALRAAKKESREFQADLIAQKKRQLRLQKRIDSLRNSESPNLLKYREKLKFLREDIETAAVCHQIWGGEITRIKNAFEPAIGAAFEAFGAQGFPENDAPTRKEDMDAMLDGKGENAGIKKNIDVLEKAIGSFSVLSTPSTESRRDASNVVIVPG